MTLPDDILLIIEGCKKILQYSNRRKNKYYLKTDNDLSFLVIKQVFIISYFEISKRIDIQNYSS